MERRQRTDERTTRVVVEVDAPRWTVWSIGVGLLLLGVSNVTAVVLLVTR
ncbi:hypothetical protein [Micromonospora sp. KC721]|nr:hypothetical protein [Micromonospora sp. KC721]